MRDSRGQWIIEALFPKKCPIIHVVRALMRIILQQNHRKRSNPSQVDRIGLCSLGSIRPTSSNVLSMRPQLQGQQVTIRFSKCFCHLLVNEARCGRDLRTHCLKRKMLLGVFCAPSEVPPTQRSWIGLRDTLTNLCSNHRYSAKSTMIAVSFMQCAFLIRCRVPRLPPEAAFAEKLTDQALLDTARTDSWLPK